MPAVSIIMAVKNAGQYLRFALDSIKAQTFQNFEVIIVDADSTDDSHEIINSYKNVRLIRQLGTGFAGAWNEGVENAKAPLICFLDADDIWEPFKLKLQHDLLCQHPEMDYSIGRVRFFRDSDAPLPSGFKASLLTGSHLGYMPGTLMIRRKVIDHIGFFEKNWKIASDIAWFRKLRVEGFPVGIIDEVLLNKRVHNSNLSYSTPWDVYRSELLSFLRGAAAQNRAGQANYSMNKNNDAS